MRMNIAIAMPAPPGQAGPYQLLSQAVVQLRWATIAVLLVLTLIEPKNGRAGLPNWAVVVLFAAYNLLADYAATRPGGRRAPEGPPYPSLAGSRSEGHPPRMALLRSSL